MNTASSSEPITILPHIVHLISLLSLHRLPRSLTVESQSHTTTRISSSALLAIGGPVTFTYSERLYLDDIQRLLERFAFKLHQSQTPVSDLKLRTLVQLATELAQATGEERITAEAGLQAAFDRHVTQVINAFLRQPPFNPTGGLVYWRIMGGGSGGISDFELVLDFELFELVLDSGSGSPQRLAVIELKTPRAVSLAGMEELDFAVGECGVYLDEEGRAQVGQRGRVVDAKYKQVLEQVRLSS